jgi:hypothetical protein
MLLTFVLSVYLFLICFVYVYVCVCLFVVMFCVYVSACVCVCVCVYVFMCIKIADAIENPDNYVLKPQVIFDSNKIDISDGFLDASFI